MIIYVCKYYYYNYNNYSITYNIILYHIIYVIFNYISNIILH